MPRRVYIETYGCQMNVADSSLMLGALGREGFVATDDPEGADVLLVGGSGGRLPDDLPLRPLLDARALGVVAGHGWLHTDDHPRVEWQAPRWLHRDTSADNTALLHGSW